MTVLITGATGLIGTQLTANLHKEGHSVHFLTTRESKLLNEPNHKGFLWNPAKRELDASCFEGVDTIVHLVGATVSKPWTKSYKQEILDSRIKTMELLRENLGSTQHQVKHFVSASGISIYPNSLSEVFTEESTEIGDNFLADVVVKWEAEADKMSELGMNVAKVRTGVVLDASQGALPQIVKPVKMGVGSALGSGKQWFPWIHLNDICGIYAYIINEGLTGVYNATASGVVTNAELTKAVAKQLGKRIILPPAPAFVLKLALGERAALVLEGQRVSSAKIEQTGYTFQFPQLGAALADLL